MIDPIQANELITLREDITEHNLSRGRIGRVLEVVAPDVFEVQFVDDHSRTIAKIRLKREQFTSLRHEATLDEAAFWKLIEDSKLESGSDIERQHEILVDKVAALSIADIFTYGRLFHRISSIAYRADLWDAAYIICGGCGDDGFTDFRAWLIAQGEKVFYDALRDPETLLDRVQIVCDGIFTYGDAMAESMNYIDTHAYEQKTGEEMPTFGGIYTSPELVGKHWGESIVEQRYPNLAVKFRGEPCSERTDRYGNKY
jgi:hypothetical protein